MGLPRDGPESSQEKRHRLMEVVFTRKMRERQIFMEDLKDCRKRKEKRVLRIMIKDIGPSWYQALSVPQREALDSLEAAIYQDHLEGLPKRSFRIIKILGISPRPNAADLMQFVNHGTEDPKAFLADFFQFSYGHSIDTKRGSYDLNARLLLSAILYLGQKNLIHLLRERFRPDPEENGEKLEQKRKIVKKSDSHPYLQSMAAYLYEPPKVKKSLPAPLPSNLEDLNEPYEEEPPLPKPPLPPPPPPPPKNRLPREYCDKVAGVMTIEPYCSEPDVSKRAQACASLRKTRGIKEVTLEKKVYGMESTRKKNQGARRRKPVPPTTGLQNAQYTINGVYTVNGRTVYVLGNVSILPADGDLIHGGFALVNGENINIHCGFRGYSPVPKPDPCDCLKKWTNTVFQYVKRTKCYCGHRYDYGNEGTFSLDEVPFFQKSTRHGPFQLNFNTIFDMDPKSLQIQKDFKKIFETDSMLRVDDGTQKKAPKKKKRSSATCLGDNPTPADYLRCALRYMRKENMAAKLPEAHLVPELQEWMRRRLHGPYSDSEKAKMINKSHSRWQVITRLSKRGVAHVTVPKEDQFTNPSNWTHKQDLNDRYNKSIRTYRLDMFRAQAEFNNLLWQSMFQAQLPDKKFREIFFSYMVGKVEDLHVIHPYCSGEVLERYGTTCNKPYTCRPEGVDPAE